MNETGQDPFWTDKTDREHLLHRIGFLEGAMEGITLYAVWKDGEQLVGVMQRPLKQVLEQYQKELERLTATL